MTSVRRTTTLDITWPDGFGGPLLLHGYGKDVRLDDGTVLAADLLRVVLEPAKRVITEITADPPRPELAALIGARAGGGLRKLLAATLEPGRPLYQMIDDLPGMSIISGMAPLRWAGATLQEPRDMENVCTGFQTGSSALLPGTVAIHEGAPPLSWQEIPDPEGPSTRRARRVEVHTRGDVLEIDAMFQDSATVPEGGRVAIHEYALRATADPESAGLLTVDATPGNLPYTECPLATATLPRLEGTPLPAFRTAVPRTLPGVHGCTHLNDALRSLTDVPTLAALP